MIAIFLLSELNLRSFHLLPEAVLLVSGLGLEQLSPSVCQLQCCCAQPFKPP